MQYANDKEINSLTFEEALSQFEDIVSKLESNSLSIEESLKLFKRGMVLSSYCTKKLQDAEGEITMLIKDEQNHLKEELFNADFEGKNNYDDI